MSRGRPTSWLYVLRRTAKGAMLSVPREVADQIPDGSMFKLEVTDTGLTYTYTTEVLRPETVAVPWVKETHEAV